MEIDKNFILIKISQFEEGVKKFHENSIYNQGAAEGLKMLLKELEEMEKQKTMTVEELVENAQLLNTEEIGNEHNAGELQN